MAKFWSISDFCNPSKKWIFADVKNKFETKIYEVNTKNLENKILSLKLSVNY